MFQGYVFVGKKNFNYFPRNILREIYAHTHRVSYGGILEKNDCDVPSHPQNGVNRNINILSNAVPYGHNPNMGWTETNKYI